MSELTTVTYEVEERVAVIRLNRPDAMNAFDRTLRGDLTAALAQAAGDDAVRVVVLAGSGRVFSAGADLKAGFPDGEQVRRQLMEEYRPALVAIAEMDKPVISAVHGSAAGIGLSFALVCDLTVMAESAFLLAPFSNIGLIPDGGANWLLPRAIGYKRAYQIAIENERVPASRCLELGLVNRVVPDEALMSETLAWARSLAVRAPIALARTKRAMREAATRSYDEVLELEAELQAGCIESEDCREGVQAFLEKRKPDFRGR